jgi:hypothetical protein
MGMGIEENETVVAKIIANDSKDVRPLAVRVKDFEVRGLTEGEAQVSLERLKNKGVVKDYKHGYGFFTKRKKVIAFEWTGNARQFADNGDEDNRRAEQEIYAIEFSPSELANYLESRRFSAPVVRLIERRGEDFYLNDEALKFTDKNSIHYKLFSILYGDDGGSKTLSYAKINSELVRLGEEKIDEQEKMIRRIKNAVNNGLYYRVDERLMQYVKIKARQGVSLINPVR